MKRDLSDHLGQQPFTVIVQIVNILGFVDHIVTVANTQLCGWSAGAQKQLETIP